MFFATTATVVIAHAIVSGIANWDRGGDRDVLTPEWWPERQITGLVYFLPFLCLWYATNASWLDLLAYYIIPAALMILTQSPGRGSYGDAATVKRRDNEKLRHLLNLIPGLEEKPDPINSELIIPNPARDAAGLFVLGLIMGLVPAAAMVYAGSWLSALVVLAGFCLCRFGILPTTSGWRRYQTRSTGGISRGLSGGMEPQSASRALWRPT